MGERVLSQIVPILQQGVESEDAETRQGVCYGLKEILENISRTQLMAYLSQLLPTIQNALCDSDAGVRQVCSLLPHLPAGDSPFGWMQGP